MDGKNKEVLISFYIKDGAHRLVDYAESTMNRKKNKKTNTIEEVTDYEPSIINFLILQKFKPTHNYINQEILNNMEGKTRFNALFKCQDTSYIQDVQSWRLLYKKYLNPPKMIQVSGKQSLLLRKNIEIRFCENLFHHEFEITQISDSLRQISKSINEIKYADKKGNEVVIKQMQRQLLIRRTQRLNYDYLNEKRLEVEKQFQNKLTKIQNLSKCLEQSEQVCGKIINLTINRWFTTLLDTLNLNELIGNQKMIVQWQNSFLQKEKQQLMAQQINGKVLFSIQQTINKLKSSTKPLDLSQQYQIRQKKFSIHSFSLENQGIKGQKQKINPWKQYEQASSQTYENKEKIRKINTTQEHDKSYQSMASRINNLKKARGTQPNVYHNTFKQAQLSYNDNKRPKQIPNPEKDNKFFGESHHNNDKNIKVSPLRPENISKFKLKSKERPQEFHQAQNFKEKNSKKPPQNIQPQQKHQKKVQLKFPIKIGNFEMQSWDFSFICYKTEDISLKQLPLNFMKDRHKFGQNRVKIEYPCRLEEGTIQIVNKSMQILNCLGAEVYCEQETSYKSINQIDSTQIISMSWLLQRPVKQIIKYYGQFFAGCPTTRK